jgi:hypothetical protein
MKEGGRNERNGNGNGEWRGKKGEMRNEKEKGKIKREMKG